jgi:hypothetical protein
MHFLSPNISPALTFVVAALIGRHAKEMNESDRHFNQIYRIRHRMLSLILRLLMMLTFDDDVIIARIRCFDVPSAADDNEFTITQSVTVHLPAGGT